MGARRTLLHTAKLTGGGSSHNGMAYFHATDFDFKRWGKYTEWSSERMRQLFAELDKSINPSFPAKTPLTEAFVNAAIALGFQQNDGFDSINAKQVGYYYTSSNNDLRSSAYSCFLKPCWQNPQSH